jgi:hypothetical protein
MTAPPPPGAPRSTRLAAILDGAPLPEDAARALWDRFSAHMDAHAGDLAGFAKAEGFTSVHPAAEGGRAILIASRTEAQQPYGSSKEAPSPAANRGKRARDRR